MAKLCMQMSNDGLQGRPHWSPPSAVLGRASVTDLAALCGLLHLSTEDVEVRREQLERPSPPGTLRTLTARPRTLIPPLSLSRRMKSSPFLGNDWTR